MDIIRNTLKTLPLLVAGTLLGAATVSQAQIYWNTVGNITADSDVVTLGRLLYAYDWDNVNQAVNGVTFTGVKVANISPNFTSSFNAFNQGALTSTANPFAALSTAYKEILIGECSGTVVDSAYQATLYNLPLGHVCMVQFWVNDPRTASGPKSETLGSTGGNSVVVKYNTSSSGEVNGYPGQFAIGIVTGSGAGTQLFSATANNTFTPSQLTALQVRDVTGFNDWGGFVNGAWDTTTTNWGTGQTFAQLTNIFTNVVFADTNTSSNAVTVNVITVQTAGISVGAVNFINNSVSYTIQNATGSPGITGTTLVDVQGSGTVTFTGTNTYTGNTTIGSGTLALGASGGINSSTNINILSGGTLNASGRSDGTLTLASGQTLTGGGNITGALTCASGATVAPGSTNTVGTLAVSGAVILGGNTYMKLSDATNDQLNASSSIAYGGSLVVTNIATNVLAAGNTFTLFSSGSYSGSFASIQLPTLEAGLTWQTNLSVNGTISVAAISSVHALTWTGVVPDGSAADWNLTATNWLYQGAGVPFVQADLVTFNDTATGSTNVNLTVNVQPGTVTFSNSALNYSISGSGQMQGAMSLTKNGTGTLTITTTDPYTGGTFLNGGVVAFGPNALGASGSNVTFNGGTLLWLDGNTQDISSEIVMNQSAVIDIPDTNVVTFQSGLAGANGVVKTDSGTLILAGANTYSGATTVSGGTLALTGSIADSSNIAIAAGAVLDVSGLNYLATGANQTITTLGPSATVNGNIKMNSGSQLALVVSAESPALIVTNGQLLLANNLIAVTVSGSALQAGTYPLVSIAAAGSPGYVTGTVGTSSLTIGGAGLAPWSEASLIISNYVLYVVVSPVLSSLPASGGAGITWNAANDIIGDSDVLTVGTLLYAYDWADVNQTVNGVTFTATSGSGASTNVASSFNNYNTTAITSTADPFAALSTAYKAILIGECSGQTVDSTYTVTLGNLPVGHMCMVQYWVSDPRGASAPKSATLSSTGGNNVVAEYDYNGVTVGYPGQYAVGLFTVSGSQPFTITGNNTATPAQMNALQVRDVTGVNDWGGYVNGLWDNTTANWGTGQSFATVSAIFPSVGFADTNALGNAVTASVISVQAAGVSIPVVNFLNNSINYTIQSGAGTPGITGPTAVNVLGSGTVTFDGSNSYTGITTIGSGVLALGSGGSISGSQAIMLDGGTLNATAVANFGLDASQPVTFAGGSLVADGLTLNGASLTNTAGPGPVITATALTYGASSSLTVAALPGFSSYPVQYPVIQYTSIAGGSLNINLTLPYGYSGYLLNDTASNSVDLVLTSGLLPILPARSLTWTGVVPDGGAADWDLQNTTNWLYDGSGVYFDQGDMVTFNDTAAGSTTVNLATRLSPGSLTVTNNLLAYTFTGPGELSGAATLVKEGTNSLVVQNSGANSFTGGILAAGGTLLMEDQSDVISGNLVATNGGQVILDDSQNNTAMAGNTLIYSNSLVQIGNNDGNGWLPTGSVTVNSGGTLLLNAANNLDITNVISGAGAIIQSNASGTPLLAKASPAFTGSALVAQGTLQFGAVGALNATVPITVKNGATLDLNGINGSNTVVAVQGAGATGQGAIFNGSGTAAAPGLSFITLTGDTYFGGNGRWDLRNGLANPDAGSPTLSALTCAGGLPCNLFKIGGNFISIADVTIDTNLANIDVQAGTLCIEGNTTGLGNPADTLTVENGAILALYEATNSLNKEFVLNDGATFENLYQTGSVSGPVTLNTNASGGPGTITFLTDATAGSATYFYFSNAISGPGNLVIQAGVSGNLGCDVVLLGTNTYTGTTTISSGVCYLLRNGSINNSATITIADGATLYPASRYDGTLTLASGQTLAGGGNITGALVGSPGTTVAPGSVSGIDTLTVSGATTLQGVTYMKLSGSASDELVSSNSISYGGTLIVSNIYNETLSAGNTFTLFRAGSYSNSFAVSQLPSLTAGLAWQNNLNVNGTISVIVYTTPPTPRINSLSQSGGNLVFSGTNGPDSGSFYLLSSTNVALPLSSWKILSTNTFDGSGNFSVTNAIVPGGPPTFFVLEIVP